MLKLVNNYEERIKNFVLKIAENPIIIKKNNNNDLNSKQSSLIFSSNNSNNISFRKNFRIKNYTTDKERVNEIIHNKTILDKYLQKIENEKKKQEIIYKKNNEPKLVQPCMRYTARTDLERIYDIIRNQENFYKEKYKIKKKLEKIGYISHSMDDNNDEYEIANEKNNKLKAIYNNKDFSNKKFYKNINKKLLNDRKNKMKKKIYLLNLITNNNNENNTYNLKDNLNQKIHFKAMENLKMFKTSTVNHNSSKGVEKLKKLKFNRNSFYETMSSKSPLINIKFKDNKINLKKKKNIFKKINSFDELILENNYKNSYNHIFNNTIGDTFNKNKKLNNLIYLRNNSYTKNKQNNISEHEEFNIIKEIINSNSPYYNINYKTVKNKSNNQTLSELKKIAFEKYDNMINSININVNDSTESNKNQSEDIKDLKKEENIIIDGKEYKKSEIDLIANKLLKKCNWNENKVNYKLNEKGGLMFTNGLTIKEFEEKYRL